MPVRIIHLSSFTAFSSYYLIAPSPPKFRRKRLQDAVKVFVGVARQETEKDRHV
jgi:hypothetical protein